MALIMLALLLTWLSKTLVCMEYCKYYRSATWSCNCIPSSIPDEINGVAIHFNDTISGLRFDDFHWKNVTNLELFGNRSGDCRMVVIRKDAFSGLENLKRLKLKTQCRMNIDPDAFVNLHSLKTLDISGCARFGLPQLIPLLNGTDKLPNLENLILSYVGSNINAVAINMQFVKVLKTKRIKRLHLDGLSLSMINITAIVNFLEHLRLLNLSYASITDWDIHYEGLAMSELNRLDMLDISHAILPARTFNSVGKVVISNQTLYMKRAAHLDVLIQRAVNASGVLRRLVSLRVENSKLAANELLQDLIKQIKVEELVARENNLNYLDVRVESGNVTSPSVTKLDLARNGLEFIHPSLSFLVPNLKHLDLSKNYLYKMAREAISKFENLLAFLCYLEWINLSANDLHIIPEDLFRKNSYIKHIDLSNNKLEQVKFRLSHLKHLQVLDLRSNSIKILDDASITTLNSIEISHGLNTKFPAVLLQSNPISCSSCKTKAFLHWLFSSKFVLGSLKSVTCTNEDNTLEYINKDTITRVQKICDRKVIIISTCTVTGCMCLVAVICALVVFMKSKHKQKMLKRENTLAQLRKGNHQYEFVAFLSFSSTDEEFVNHYVKQQLNENLKLMTGIDRNLVCVGDEYLRPGFMVYDETIRCIERSSVAIAMVTDDYCQSGHCHHELDQAYRLQKPIILMLKENVDVNLMMPTMRLLFRNNVRVLWTRENEEYVLKTSWENVCLSILDLIT